MSAWQTRMKRGTPSAGKVEMVIGIKTADGGRLEIAGEFDKDVGREIFDKAVLARYGRKERVDG